MKSRDRLSQGTEEVIPAENTRSRLFTGPEEIVEEVELKYLKQAYFARGKNGDEY